MTDRSPRSEVGILRAGRLARLQGWLLLKPWPLWRIGNGLSTVRYWRWRLMGGQW